MEADHCDLEDVLDGMVRDLLPSSSTSGGDGGGGSRISRLHPKDASSLIRLLGNARAHDAMLVFMRGYCRNVADRRRRRGRDRHENVKDDDDRDRRSRAYADDTIRHAYAAAISSMSRPTSRHLGRRPSSSSLSSGYRNGTFLMTLVDEMEREYCVLPNSYVLSGVLLGVDDMHESLDMLGEFERRYAASEKEAEDEDGVEEKMVKEGEKEEEEEEEEEKEDTIMTVHVYNVALACCSRDASGKGWQKALSLLRRMRRLGPEPDEVTYSHVLAACSAGGQTNVAFSLIDEIRGSRDIRSRRRSSRHPSPSDECGVGPSSGLYLPLLRVCANAGQHARVRSIIDMMEKDGLGITTGVMNSYLLSLAKNGLSGRASSVLDSIIPNERDSSSSSFSPDIISYNTVLMAHANDGDYDGARDLLDRMILLDGDIKPDVASYNTVISCADPRDALSLIQEMRLTRRNRGVGVLLPNSVTYVNAISRCRKATLDGNDPDVAFEIAMTLLDMAREDDNDAGKGIDLNVYVYSASIWIAEAVGDYRTAARLLREMGCEPNGVCYDGVISALSKHGLHREALYLYYEMTSKGLAATRKTYQRLACVIEYSRDPELSRPKKIALLAGLISKLPVKDRNVRVGGPLFESIIRNHENATDPKNSYQSARMAFDSIIGPVDDACLSAMLRVCSTAEPVRWNEALLLIHSSDIVSEASRPGFVSSRALSLAVIACAKADQYEEALNLIELYGKRYANEESIAYWGESVSAKAMNAVISACGRRSRPDVAVRILNDMKTMCGVEPEEASYRLAIIACNQAEHRGKYRSLITIGPELKWWECALSLLRRMKEDGLKPSMQTISSVVSACEAAGEWQRALGVLQSIFPLLGEGEMDQMGIPELPNLYCINAAIAACEKGGAWVEALQLYENLRSTPNSEHAVRPNFITVNSLLIALERAQQNELAGSIYIDAVKEKTVSPWRHRYDNDGVLRRMMVSERELRLFFFLLSFFLMRLRSSQDLHKFSVPMAKIAVRSFIENDLISQRRKLDNCDVVFIVGKGKRSED